MFAKALSTVTTNNGAVSHGSTGSGRVDFFYKVLRNTPDVDVERFLSTANSESEVDAAKLVFQLRNCRGGKGERKPVYTCFLWYANNGKMDFVERHLKYLPFFGYWKDLNTFFGTPIEPLVIKLYTEILAKDRLRLLSAKLDQDGYPITSISLAAKWVPKEKSKCDRNFSAAKKIAKSLGVSQADYRKLYIAPLNKHIDVVETFMCKKEWDQIEYGQVPSVCMMKHRKAFARNDAERFAAYLESVKKGEAKINAKQLFPHELASHYVPSNTIARNLLDDPVINAQWEALVKFSKTQAHFSRCIAVCDVSGSMDCPIGGDAKSSYRVLDASVGLSLLMAECVAEPFRNQIITFSATPRFHKIAGNSLKERIKNMVGINDWGMTTNFQAVFDMILEKAVSYIYTDATGVLRKGIPQDEMPTTVFVFSDMQFNQARFCTLCHTVDPRQDYQSVSGKCYCPPNQITNLDAITAKYRAAGYPRPQLVFWNLSGNTPDFPATSDETGVALVSGYSPSMMKLFMNGMSLNPYNAMRAAIDDPVYDVVCGGPTQDKTLDELFYGKTSTGEGTETLSDIESQQVKKIKI